MLVDQRKTVPSVIPSLSCLSDLSYYYSKTNGLVRSTAAEIYCWHWNVQTASDHDVLKNEGAEPPRCNEAFCSIELVHKELLLQILPLRAIPISERSILESGLSLFISSVYCTLCNVNVNLVVAHLDEVNITYA